MADQNRRQSNPEDRGQQGGRSPDEDQSTGIGQARERSTREPASRADDRGIENDELDRDPSVESDLDDVDDLNDVDDIDRNQR